jgi:hypothetical protein
MIEEGVAWPPQAQGVHHITMVGANRQTSVDFWEGVLGMSLVFEQPNLDDAGQNHLYFDPGDGRLITIFTSDPGSPIADPIRPAPAICTTWHLPYRARPIRRPWRACASAVLLIPARSIEVSGIRSIFANHSVSCWSWPAMFEPPVGATHADVLREAHNIRVAAGAHNIADEHLADAIEALSRTSAAASRRGLSCGRKVGGRHLARGRWTRVALVGGSRRGIDCSVVVAQAAAAGCDRRPYRLTDSLQGEAVVWASAPGGHARKDGGQRRVAG